MPLLTKLYNCTYVAETYMYMYIYMHMYMYMYIYMHMYMYMYSAICTECTVQSGVPAGQ